MEFKQYVTGRATRIGYGFVAQSEELTFDSSTFRKQRDLTQMPANSMVMELHAVDDTRTALVMTRVETMGNGSATFCYNHALITDSTLDPAQLIQALVPDSFMRKEEFLSLEDQPNRLHSKTINLPPREAQMPQGLAPEALRQVMPSLIGYMWRVCDQRRQGEKTIAAAEIILPTSFQLRQLEDFYVCAILAYLPDDLKRHASVVFGASSGCYGAFPSNTACFITTETGKGGHIPSFDLVTGEVRSAGNYTDPIVSRLGESLLKEKPFQERIETVWSRLPEWRGIFSAAYRMEYLELLDESDRREMRFLENIVYANFDWLRKKITAQGKNETEARTILNAHEQLVFSYWRGIGNNEKLPQVLYQSFVYLALTSPSGELWQRWLDALSLPVDILSDKKTVQRDYDVLFSKQGTPFWTLAPDRFGMLVLRKLQNGAEPGMAWKALNVLPDDFREQYGIQQEIIRITEAQIDCFDEGTIWQIFISPAWKTEKTKIQDCVFRYLGEDCNRLMRMQEDIRRMTRPDDTASDVGRIDDRLRELYCEFARRSPTAEKLTAVCNMLKADAATEETSILLQTARRIDLNEDLAERIAQHVIGLESNEKRERVKKEVFDLFEAKPFPEPMWKLLEQYSFDYDRTAFRQWEQVEVNQIAAQFSESVASASNVNSLSQIPQTWKKKCKIWNLQWETLLHKLPGAETAVQTKAKQLLGSCMLHELKNAASMSAEDDFGKIIQEELRSVLANDMQQIVHQPENGDSLNEIPDMLNQMGMSGKSKGIYEDFILNAIKITRSEEEKDFMIILNQLTALFRENHDNVLRDFSCKQVRISQGVNRWFMLKELLFRLDDLKAGWEAYFRSMDWLPEKRANPWGKDTWLINPIHVTCRKIVALGASEAVRQSLCDYLKSGEWADFTERMEDDDACQHFYRDKAEKAPKLKDLLNL